VPGLTNGCVVLAGAAAEPRPGSGAGCLAVAGWESAGPIVAAGSRVSSSNQGAGVAVDARMCRLSMSRLTGGAGESAPREVCG
jgi:NADPH:quinone reductase-like Zn-dependent oxidoreductase